MSSWSNKGSPYCESLVLVWAQLYPALTDLRNRGSENDNFIKFSNSLHELIDTGSFNDIDIVIVALDLNRYCEICLMQYLEQY